jgi:hypothetical protein
MKAAGTSRSAPGAIAAGRGFTFGAAVGAFTAATPGTRQSMESWLQTGYIHPTSTDDDVDDNEDDREDT